jgi:hypothetical protein
MILKKNLIFLCHVLCNPLRWNIKTCVSFLASFFATFLAKNIIIIFFQVNRELHFSNLASNGSATLKGACNQHTCEKKFKHPNLDLPASCRAASFCSTTPLH